MVNDSISFKDAVEIRRQEMHSILPNMQTKFDFNGKSVVIRSATSEERMRNIREGKVVSHGK